MRPDLVKDDFVRNKLKVLGCFGLQGVAKVMGMSKRSPVKMATSSKLMINSDDCLSNKAMFVIDSIHHLLRACYNITTVDVQKSCS